MKNDKLMIILSLLIILLCLGLSAKLIIESKQYSCDKCEVHFKSKGFYEKDYRILNYSIVDLFEEYEKGFCAVSWDYNQGYIKMRIMK